MSESKNSPYCEKIESTIAELTELDAKLGELLSFAGEIRNADDKPIVKTTIRNIIYAEDNLFLMMFAIATSTSKRVFDVASEDRFAKLVKQGGLTYRGDRFVKFERACSEICDDKFIDSVKVCDEGFLVEFVSEFTSRHKGWRNIWEALRSKYCE